MVYLLTKDENITYNILNELQIFHLSWYAITPRKFHRGKVDTYDEELMLNTHTNLITHPTKKNIFVSNFVYDRIQMLRQYCDNYLNNNDILFYIVVYGLSWIIV